MKALLIPVKGEPEVIETEAKLEDLQHIVGGHIECVMLDSIGTHIYCNEEGKIQGLPINEIASFFVHQRGQLAMDYLVGDVVILGSDGEGDEADLDDGFLENWTFFWNKMKEMM